MGRKLACSLLRRRHVPLPLPLDYLANFTQLWPFRYPGPVRCWARRPLHLRSLESVASAARSILPLFFLFAFFLFIAFLLKVGCSCSCLGFVLTPGIKRCLELLLK